MKRLVSCEFNLGTVCVELRHSDGAMIAIDTDAVEQDHLVCNDPASYADPALNSDVKAQLSVFSSIGNTPVFHPVGLLRTLGFWNFEVFFIKSTSAYVVGIPQ